MFLLVSGFWFLVSGLSAFASEITIDDRRIAAHDILTITLTLEDEFASLDEVHLPLRNLVTVGEPWTATEFAFLGNRLVPRKVFRYRARAISAGPAQVGPIVLRTPDGKTDTLAAITVEILPDRVLGSNDAEVVLRELEAAGRDPMFVVAEIDKTSVYAGEPVIIEWILYNAATIQTWQLVAVPKLPDFWVEELTKNERGERAYVGNLLMQRVPVRRAALFPLRSGRLRVDGMTIEATLMRRAVSGPFARYEGVLAETSFTSAPIDIDVHPIPPGPPVDAVGDLTLRCEPPVQRNGGPVVVKAMLSGIGNLRAAAAPRMERAIAGSVQIEGSEVTVARDEGSFAMSREWRYLVFPSRAETLEIPPLAMRVFVPVTQERRDLRCEATRIEATTIAPPQHVPPPAAEPAPVSRWPWMIAAALVAGLALLIPRALRAYVLRRDVREIVRAATPAEIRARVEARVHIDPNEPSDRGDAWRALRSLLDAAERERDIAVDAEKEIARRVADVLRTERRRPGG